MYQPLNVGQAVTEKKQLEDKILSLIADYCVRTGLDVNTLDYRVTVARFGTGGAMIHRELNLIVTLP